MTTIDVADLELGPVLGRGGQAEVVEAATTVGATFAFKRYNERQLQNASELRRKLASMLDHPPDDPTASFGHTSIAWPRHLVVASGDFVGFLMDSLEEPHLTIPDVRDEAGRRAADVSFGWGQLLTCARNLCSAVAALHEVGAAWGDLNEGNIAIYPDGLVTLLDIDACAWRSADGEFEAAGLGVEEFMAPERFTTSAAVTPEGDCWALAVIVHLILMEGFHPFLFVPPDLDRAPSMEERVTAGMSPLLNRELAPPRLAPDPSTLPPAVVDAFRATFGPGRGEPDRRTTALEWVEILDAASTELATCAFGHVYGRHSMTCPWCELDERRQTRRTGHQVRLDPEDRAHPVVTAEIGDGSARSDQGRSTPAPGRRPWRWLSLAVVSLAVGVVAAVAGSEGTFRAESFAFPTAALAFLAVFHAESERPIRLGFLHLLGLGITGAFLFELVPPERLAADATAVAAIVPVLAHLAAVAVGAVRQRSSAGS